MGRTPRHRSLILVALAACGTTAAPSIDVTTPAFVELVRGQPASITWTATSFDAAKTSVKLLDRADATKTYALVTNGAGGAMTSAPTATGFSWGGNAADGTPVPPGFYDLSIDAGDGFVDAGDSHIVVVQGLVFTQPAPLAQVTLAKGGTVELDFTTSNVSAITIDLAVGGATIHSSSIGGELHAMARTLTWNGTDTGGAPVAAGSYPLTATIHPAAGASYVVTGGTVVVP